jgi:hypothetical protein
MSALVVIVDGTTGAKKKKATTVMATIPTIAFILRCMTPNPVAKFIALCLAFVAQASATPRRDSSTNPPNLDTPPKR